MKRLFALLSFAVGCSLAACSKPTDIVFGPEPLKQMADQGEQFRKLPEADRQLLAGYLAASEMSKALGGFATAMGASAPQGSPTPVASPRRAEGFTRELSQASQLSQIFSQS